MKKVSKILNLAAVVALSAVFLCACAFEGNTKTVKTLNIVCTSFPQYDFTRQIIGDNLAGIEVAYLAESGVDMHNFQASADDIIKVNSSDLFIYTGGESEAWVEDLVKQSGEGKLNYLALVDVVEMKEEEIVEGMENEEEEEGEEEEGLEFDEHVWLSLRNAEIIVKAICSELCDIDPENSGYYSKNADVYVEKLKSLDNEYIKMIENAKRKTILVADRFPFRYMADDYGLDYYAAFVGCSAETEASFETIAYLAEKTDELKLPVVLIIDGSDGSIAKTVIENSSKRNASVMTLNSLQSVSRKEIDAGMTYMDVMAANLQVMKEALN
ncbi:MAG: metal ABC transporter substrate-binding protein [Sedimentibacter sp.]|uniref:metal ABC transporter substrate-binding protein n=1 Tax=Sedimentibacter sp. TaxID=1960295 RepID=UPI003158DC80